MKNPRRAGVFRSRPVSRILSRVTISLGRRLPGRLERRTRPLGGSRQRGHASPCTGRGLASRRVTTTLVGSYPTVSPLPSASPESLSLPAVSFLCHFPSAFAVWDFPSILPFGVRTFLEPRTARGHPACKLNCSRGSSAPSKHVPHSGQETDPPRLRTNSPHTRHSRLAPRMRASSS